MSRRAALAFLVAALPWPAVSARAGDLEAERNAVDEALRNALRGIRTEPSLAQRVREHVGDFLASILARLTSATASGPGKALAIAIAAALVVAGVWLLGRRIRLVPERQAPGRHDGHAEPADWRRIAEEAAARGDLATAVRAHYQLLLRALDERGVLRWEPSVTAGECRNAVARVRPELGDPVVVATAAFERVAYGHEPAARAHVEALHRAVDFVGAATDAPKTVAVETARVA